MNTTTRNPLIAEAGMFVQFVPGTKWHRVVSRSAKTLKCGEPMRAGEWWMTDTLVQRMVCDKCDPR